MGAHKLEDYIKQLQVSVPEFQDPEDIGDDTAARLAPRAVENGNDEASSSQPSVLRRRTAALWDVGGRKTSRKELYGDSSDNESGSDGDSEEEGTAEDEKVDDGGSDSEDKGTAEVEQVDDSGSDSEDKGTAEVEQVDDSGGDSEDKGTAKVEQVDDGGSDSEDKGIAKVEQVDDGGSDSKDKGTAEVEQVDGDGSDSEDKGTAEDEQVDDGGSGSEEEEEEAEMLDDGDSDDEKEEEFSHQQSNESDESEKSEDDDEEEEAEGGASDEEITSAESEEEEVIMQDTVVDDGVKAKAVVQQLDFWDRIMEARIKLQKCLSLVNQLPDPSHFQASSLLSEGRDVLLEINCTLHDLHNTPSSSPKKRKADTDVDELACQSYESLQTERNKSLSFWDEKTRLASKNFKMFKSYQTPVLKQVEQILSDRDRLVRRTQVIRDSDAPDHIDKPEEKFDDNDFYQRLLRNLIESKAADESSMSSSASQWLEVQRLRGKKKKKKGVDTRASKGRKLRYNVHSKLVNFMAPRDDSTWSEDAKNELFKNLFKMPSHSES